MKPPDTACAVPLEYDSDSERVLRDPLRGFWFRAAVLVGDSLSTQKVFAPGASVLVGPEAPADFLVPGVESVLQVVSNGSHLHLLETSLVRMSGPHGQRYTVARSKPGRDVVVATEQKVNFLLREGLSLFLYYAPTRDRLFPKVAEG